MLRRHDKLTSAVPARPNGRPLVLWGDTGQYYLEDAALPDHVIWCDQCCLGGAMPTRAVTLDWSRP